MTIPIIFFCTSVVLVLFSFWESRQWKRLEKRVDAELARTETLLREVKVLQAKTAEDLVQIRGSRAARQPPQGQA